MNHRSLKIVGSLSSQQIQEVANLEDQEHFQNALRNILVPRVVGTPGWKNVQNFIINELKSMDMTVELDSFEDQTPIFGKLNFVNIIGKLNPSADRFLVLSAHYDSKYFPNSEFVGATGQFNVKMKNYSNVSTFWFHRFSSSLRNNA